MNTQTSNLSQNQGSLFNHEYSENELNLKTVTELKEIIKERKLKSGTNNNIIVEKKIY